MGAKPTGKQKNDGGSEKMKKLQNPWMMRVPHLPLPVLPFLSIHLKALVYAIVAVLPV
jgi:hypothetical protein